MKLNRTELKKILYGFNSISNRLMRVHYDEYNHVLVKFLEYINLTSVIKEYIDDCGAPSIDVADECKQVATSYGRLIFDLGETDQLEIANIYAILTHISNGDINAATLGRSYTSSNKFQDAVKEFNERVLMVLIRHIEGYLTKIGIDMGMDESVKYSITVNNGQVNLASDNASINATQNNGLNSAEILQLLQQVKVQIETFSDLNDKNSATESIEVLDCEVIATKPKKSMIRTALAALQSIKGTAEFTAAVVALVQFIQPLL